MGKKRRLISAKSKFSGKHSSHPRMAALNRKTNLSVAAEDATPTVETVIEPVLEAQTEESTIAIKETQPTQAVDTTVAAATNKTTKNTTSKKRTTTTRTRRKSRAKSKTSVETSA